VQAAKRARLGRAKAKAKAKARSVATEVAPAAPPAEAVVVPPVVASPPSPTVDVELQPAALRRGAIRVPERALRGTHTELFGTCFTLAKVRQHALSEDFASPFFSYWLEHLTFAMSAGPMLSKQHLDVVNIEFQSSENSIL
jgi:hypothetical protein